MANYDVEEVIKNIFNQDPTWKPLDKIPLIFKELESRKGELKIFLNNNHYDILNIINESEKLCSDSNVLVDCLETYQKKIEDESMAEILKSVENCATLAKELQCVSFSTSLVGNVIKCGKYVKEFEEGRKQPSFTRSAEAVFNLVNFLNTSSRGLDYLDIAKKTSETAQLILDNLTREVNSKWSSLLSWKVQPSTCKTVISINVKFDESRYCSDVLKALEVGSNLTTKIWEFSNFLCFDVFKPIINNKCAIVIESNDNVTITITHEQNSDVKPMYNDVIENLTQLLTFLSKKLDINYKGSDDDTLMIMVAEVQRINFANLLIDDCLLDTIPHNIADLHSYDRITMQIEEFQRFLVSIKFFPPNNTISILQYINNIDKLFADKSSYHFLDQARTIMFKDLSDTMSIGVEYIPKEPNSSTNDYEALNIFDKTIPKSLFYFPRCMISKSAQELLDLVYTMMEQAVQCSDVVCRKLYSATRYIFELYEGVVPYYHEKYLQTIPQYVALFHNNCMFLAHNMQTFGDKWLSLLEGRNVTYPVSFVDLVYKLRELGYKHLTIHMQQQRKQILDNIRSSDLNCIVVKDKLGDNAEAAIRQCLRHLQLLKNVWIGVFPQNVYSRLMSTLVNMFVAELIHRVCTVEDISMEMAGQLTDMYSLVVQKAPSLFLPAPVIGHGGITIEEDRLLSTSEMQTYVASWIKLQELIFVLSGSLRDIENHWNEGTGPLAIHFRVEELRSLIKALFQNTQIRANLLSKIIRPKSPYSYS